MSIEPTDKAKINSFKTHTYCSLEQKVRKVTTQDIANEARVSTELNYKYFPGGQIWYP